MKIINLPLNVPVLITYFNMEYAIIRVNDNQIVWKWLDESRYSDPYTLDSFPDALVIDSPTDEDAAELTLSHAISRPEDNFLGSKITVHITSKVACSCPLYGANGIMAVGCQCGGQ